MRGFNNLKSRLDRAPSDVLGLDLASHGIRAVRMKKNGEALTLSGTAFLPPVVFGNSEKVTYESLALPAKLRGRLAALAMPAKPGAVKLLRVPESFDPANYEDVMSRLGYEGSGESRLSSAILVPGSAKVEMRILAAVMPEADANNMLKLMPAAGAPAARSLELSELAVINAFHNDGLLKHQEGACGLIHFDHDFSLIALFNNNILSQVRLFTFGVGAVLQKVIKALNVDEATAEGVLADGAFDLSHLIEDGFRDIRSQLVISRDFMERSEDCALGKIYISGPDSLVRPFSAGMPAHESITAWDVLAPYADKAATEPSVELAGDAWRWSAAVGSCLGLLLSP